jgi:hypothetical protein
MINEKFSSITILKPDVQGFSNLYNYYFYKKQTPSRLFRSCTDKFKVRVIQKYITIPCFMLIGFSTDESHRARISSKNGVENRFPLIEMDKDREGCEEIIQKSGLSLPIKSGCFLCPFQPKKLWKKLKRDHPNLFCKAEQLEKRNMDDFISKDKKPHGIMGDMTLSEFINQKQGFLFSEMEYPPCNCGL